MKRYGTGCLVEYRGKLRPWSSEAGRPVQQPGGRLALSGRQGGRSIILYVNR